MLDLITVLKKTKPKKEYCSLSDYFVLMIPY